MRRRSRGKKNRLHSWLRMVSMTMLTLSLLYHYARADVPQTEPLDAYQNNILDSGGTLLAEQAALDIHYYDLDLFIDPGDSSLHGSVITRARILEKTDLFVAHLDTVFTTHRVLWLPDDERPEPLEFTHKMGLVIVPLPVTLTPGEPLNIEIAYSGQPRPAPNPPWEGGFIWSYTDAGHPWIGVSCQLNGADIWWPVKDHPSDRPDSVSLKITVPYELKAVSNGVLRSVNQYSEDTRTFHWATNYPVNNYAVTVNIGPYVQIDRQYESISGDIFPIRFWALPENRNRAEQLMRQIFEHMRFFEEILGPYPFRKEKYGVVEAPFFGMEHQTVIAYGAGYENDTVFETGSGFDDLHHHELAHEWWGNMLTVSDWKDLWLHEGFATYMQPLYVEQRHGKEQYRFFMKKLYDRISNTIAIAPKKSRSAREMFDGRDIYMKGAWVLHTLRHLVGDEHFLESLRRMTYPEPEQEAASRKAPSRFADTRGFVELMESVSGRDLNWFFETYLRHKELPELKKHWEEDRLYISWSVPSGEPFPMPVEVFDGKEKLKIIPDGNRSIMIHDSEMFRIDPDYRVLRKGMYR